MDGKNAALDCIWGMGRMRLGVGRLSQLPSSPFCISLPEGFF